MSGQPKGPKPPKPPKRPRALAPIGDYEVGYCKPPRTTQFQKGQPSANPKGRPRKAQPLSPLQQGATNGFHKMTLEEAMRPVQVRDGSRVITMPAYQAAVRATHIKAATGHAQSMRNVITLTKDAQAATRAEKEEMFENAIAYKRANTAYARRCDEQGIDHGLLIHPDDIDIDILEGEVIIRGPLTPEEREAYLLHKNGVQVAKTFLIEACAEFREHPRKPTVKKRITDTVELIRRCNEVLPRRDHVDAYAVLREQGVSL